MKKSIFISLIFSLTLSNGFGQVFEFGGNDRFGINPFSDIDTSRNTLKFKFIDTDNDGDQDLLLTGYILSDTAAFPPRSIDVEFFIEHQENIGDKWNPQFATRKGTMDSLPYPRGESFFFPEFADLNSDGRIDLIASAEVDEFYTQHLLFYTQQNNGSFDTTRSAFYELDPFLRMSSFFPEFIDLDADGDHDIMMCGFQPGVIQGAEDENIFLYAKNTGTKTNPEFLGWFDNPYGLQPDTIPSLLVGGDLDLDGDVDLLELGLNQGSTLLAYHENQAGIDGRPVFSGKIMSPFDLPIAGPNDGYFFPSIVDIDGDGDLDLFLPYTTETDYNLQFWENKICDLGRSSVEAMICEGEEYELEGQTFNETGTYTLEVKDSSGCIAIIELTLEVAKHDTTYIDEETCFGEVISIAGQQFDTSGIYELSVMSSSGCDSTIIATLDFQEVDVTVSQQGPTLTAIDAADYSYQWLDCNSGMPIDSATSNVFEAEVSGDYAVIIMNDIGCVDTSDCISVISTGNDNSLVEDKFQVIPNPARSEFTLFSQDGLVPDQVFLRNKRGGMVMDLSSHSSGKIKVDHLPAGIYLLIIKQDGKTELERVAILK